jgi:ribosomal protein L3 glutamine methyltransferase
MRKLTDDLLTLRDFLRYAVSRFREAGIVYGHGTANAMDEAAFLLLWGLHLPIDRIDPFADARLTLAEREKLVGLIETRISTRKPAAYITGEAWIKGHSFVVDERVIVPRSFIGELLADPDAALPLQNREIRRVLDLCTGSGCLAILAAMQFPGAAVDAVELSADAAAVAQRNIADYGLESQVRLLTGDLFAPVSSARYDLIISNPPYVTDDAVDAFPPEYASEPKLAHAGGPDGLDIVRRILAGASAHLEPDGELLVEVGSGQLLLTAEFPQLPFLWLDTEASEGEVFLLSAEALTTAKLSAAANWRRK